MAVLINMVKVIVPERRTRGSLFVEKLPIDDYIYRLIENANRQPTTLDGELNTDDIDKLATFESKLKRRYIGVVYKVFNMLFYDGVSENEICKECLMSMDVFEEIRDIIRILAFRSMNNAY